MASTKLRADSAGNNPENDDPTVTAFLRAFALEREANDRTIDPADDAFAHAAFNGAYEQSMFGRIGSLQHAALATLLAIDTTDKVLEGFYSTSRNPVERELAAAVRSVQAALANLLRYNRIPDALLPYAKHVGMDPIPPRL